jgi:hypothetical protein
MELMMNEQALQDRLNQINERLAELLVELANRPQDHSYERQELLTEKNELLTQRRLTERALRDLNTPTPQPDPRREKFIAAEVANRREHTLAFIEKLERSGDHRQARLWRGELIGLREQVEREFPHRGNRNG